MRDVLELIADNRSAAGIAVTSTLIVLAAVAVRLVVRRVVGGRFGEDAFRRYWAEKIVGYSVAAIAVMLIILVWAPLGGQLSIVLGLATAGVAFAAQEVIGALFGWLNVIGGRVYNVGDRIEIGTVRGDVLDITPLRTKVLEIGSDPQLSGDGPTSWVGARQPTGRVVAVSNKKTFTDPVFNYSAHLDWVWEELSVAIPQGGDWRAAEQAVAECVREFRPAAREHGEAVLENLGTRYPLDRADVRTRTFIRLSGGDVEITARFVTPVRTSRLAKDEILRRVLERFERDGIVLAHPTYSVEIGAAAQDGADAR